jgi:hypothetical protein
VPAGSAGSYVRASSWHTFTPLGSSPWMAAVQESRGPGSSPLMIVTGTATGSPREVSLTSERNCRFSPASTSPSYRNGRGSAGTVKGRVIGL